VPTPSVAVAKLRRQGLASGSLVVFVGSNPFKASDRQYHGSQLVTLPAASASTPRLIQAARAGLRMIWWSGVRADTAT
jgi:DNA polymerase V